MKSVCSGRHRHLQKHLGWLAGLFLQRFGRKPPEKNAAHMYKQDFSTSTQRLGLRFTDRLRDVFRRHWLRLK
ncbi:MAG TPA: hypothetical protein PK052_08970 [Anaerohalosphaeraceae bacterium]|nr:hypothetical protein [Phycisphaerae bacterium]HOL32101.1 hypothetical protein [Anaerohalosphaeraceae bacterium]HOM76365.1 hypothetical protein [Anaerohalosphaeraceae bacterium]HRS70945.1 hypothetical protein [Anaerohalosphaeraceae bacterium]